MPPRRRGVGSRPTRTRYARACKKPATASTARTQSRWTTTSTHKGESNTSPKKASVKSTRLTKSSRCSPNPLRHPNWRNMLPVLKMTDTSEQEGVQQEQQPMKIPTASGFLRFDNSACIYKFSMDSDTGHIAFERSDVNVESSKSLLSSSMVKCDTEITDEDVNHFARLLNRDIEISSTDKSSSAHRNLRNLNEQFERVISTACAKPALCKICMVRDQDCIILPCGHFMSCERCVSSILSCPICRIPIDETKKVFMG